MKEIKLQHGYVTLVDDELYNYLNQWKWHYHAKFNKKYVRRSVIVNGKQKTIHMHRLIANTPVGMMTDHINHDTLDNRQCNLRICSRIENNRNNKSRGESKYLGVYFVYHKDKKYIRSCINVNGKRLHLGTFKTEENAAKAYNDAASLYYKEFANLNIINQ